MRSIRLVPRGWAARRRVHAADRRALANDPDAGPLGVTFRRRDGARLPDGTPLRPTYGAGPARRTPSRSSPTVAHGRSTPPRVTRLPVPPCRPGAVRVGAAGRPRPPERLPVRGLGGAPDLLPVDESIGPFDWGHPIGRAIVFADDRGIPRKRFLPEGNLIRLTSLPPGNYLEVAYHPSGLALAFVVETPDGQDGCPRTRARIRNGSRFSETGTEFTSLAFSANGKTLWWTAQHAEGYPELHFMQLENRSGFGTAWRGTEGTVADGPPAPAVRRLRSGHRRRGAEWSVIAP